MNKKTMIAATFALALAGGLAYFFLAGSGGEEASAASSKGELVYTGSQPRLEDFGANARVQVTRGYPQVCSMTHE